MSKETAAWEREFQLHRHNPLSRFESYNIAPTQQAPVIVEVEGERRMDMMRWGLIPSWAKDMKIGNQCINARAETVAEKPAYRSAIKHRRCLVPATGYYEWQKLSDGKLPHYITSADDKPLGFAGIWETWTDASGNTIRTYAILTCDVNAALSFIHDRMPVILDANDFDMWLNGTPDQAVGLAVPTMRDLQAHPISRAVNSPKNNGPELLMRVQ